MDEEDEKKSERIQIVECLTILRDLSNILYSQASIDKNGVKIPISLDDK
jgi:hypothetical protein